MGVPKFFRWLSSKYPNINLKIDDLHLPEFDNLYLDMNGIIHNCSHPSDSAQENVAMDETEVFLDVFSYIDQLIRIIKPKKYFFLAVDGPAPRAKMNQQRSRRFRSAQATENAMNLSKKSKFPKELFDSNCITPGTEFMDKLSNYLEFFIQKKVNEDPLWKAPKIIYSSHLVPGEGEHKIMDFIRNQKLDPDYHPSTRHCLYGLDADLIMLGLASHEPNFALLREVITSQGPRSKKQNFKLASTTENETCFHLLHLSLLRDYITLDVGNLITEFAWDKERVIDDIVLLIMFVGNDFLPHLPHFDIAHGTLDLLMEIYPIYLSETKEYLQDAGTINMKGLSIFFEKLPSFQAKVHEKKKQTDKKTSVGASSASQPTNDAIEGELDDETEFGEGMDSEQVQEMNAAYYTEKFESAYTDNPDFVGTLALEYVKGLCWVAKYYYQGCPSWDWFYPFHYAPFASDLIKIPKEPFQFQKGIAVLPWKQLLAVLPPFSCRLLPAPFRKLMTSEDSPLIKYYPRNFEIDMNGKKNDWEAVVVIPFIDWGELTTCIEAIPITEFSEEDLKRNVHGQATIIQYDSSASRNVASPIPEQLRDLNSAKVRASSYSPFPLPENYLYPSALNPFTISQRGFPRLDEKLLLVAKTAQSKSARRRGPPMTILDLTQEEAKCNKELADSFLGKQMMVGWPHSAEAKIISHCDGFVYSEWDSASSSIKRTALSSEMIGKYESESRKVLINLESKQGIRIKTIKYLFTVQHFDGFQITPEGIAIVGFLDFLSYVPFCLLRPETLLPQGTIHPPPKKEISSGSSVLFLQRKNIFLFGRMVDVVAIDNGKYSIECRDSRDIDPKILEDYMDQFHTFGETCSILRVRPMLLSKITGSINVNPGKVDIGLRMKFTGKELQMGGYVERDDRPSQKGAEWVFTEAAVEIIAQYLNRIREIVRVVENSNEMFIDLTPILKDKAEDYIADVKGWIESLPISKLPLSPFGSYGMSVKQSTVVQKVLDEYNRRNRNRPMRRNDSVQEQFLCPSHAFIPKEMIPLISDVQLIDRIVYVGDSAIPFGSPGIVIGINPSANLVEIIFDNAFLGGTNLNGKCSVMRGGEVSVKNIIDISHLIRSGPEQGQKDFAQSPAPGPLPLSWASPSNPKPAPAPFNWQSHGKSKERQSQPQTQNHAHPQSSPSQLTTQANTTRPASYAKPTPYQRGQQAPAASAPSLPPTQSPPSKPAALSITIKTREVPPQSQSPAQSETASLNPPTTLAEKLSHDLRNLLQIGELNQGTEPVKLHQSEKRD